MAMAEIKESCLMDVTGKDETIGANWIDSDIVEVWINTIHGGKRRSCAVNKKDIENLLNVRLIEDE